ncbi:MAG TPA: gliding motility protein GldM [Cyclobacteriaceae bacterium]|jgi:gliding motility-associated protein GldM|nr:gliding motility protein GldM [Cyclobacteriaceae bacterium]
MAGGKETPRQKMIGMMYLVLTALLALQVSSAVLEKFAIINETLDGLIKTGNEKSNQILTAIVDEAGKSTNPKVTTAKENAQKVRELTQTTMKSIEEIKKKMLEISKTDKIDEKFIANHGSDVAVMMIDTKSPWGKKYQDLLKEYVVQLEQLSGKKFEKLDKAPADIPLFAENTNHKNKDFLTFTFENTPGIAAFASVTQTQTEILDYEATALDKLREDAGAGTVKFDKVVPMVRPKSSIVAAGAKYEADMFITASSSAAIPEFYKDGVKLEVVDDVTGVKMGKVSFTTTGGGYNADGLAKKSFKAEIKLKGETYPQEVEYYVAQPIIRVTTGNAPTLYMNCGNNVNIEVPSLSTSYNPSFSSNGAEVIKGDKPGKVTIIPSQRKVTVNVSNGGTSLGGVNFDVKTIPRPRYVPKDNSGKEISQKDGVRGSALTGMRVIAEAEENFKTEVPKDATYRIRSMEVIHARGTAPVNRMTATNENIDMSSWRAQFRPGDRIVIEIKTVTRRTYKGEDEKVEVKSEIINVPIQ